jgi:hypothetical protein
LLKSWPLTGTKPAGISDDCLKNRGQRAQQAIASLSLGHVCSDEDEHEGRHVAHAPETTQFSFVAALAHLNVWTKPEMSGRM